MVPQDMSASKALEEDKSRKKRLKEYHDEYFPISPCAGGLHKGYKTEL